MLNVSIASTVTKKLKASDWVGVHRRLVQKTNIGRRDTTFLARCSQRRGDARASLTRARPSLLRATASRKNKRGKRSRDQEIAKKNSSRATREQGFEIRHVRARTI